MWKYQQANDNDTAVIAKKKKVNLSTYASWSAQTEKRHLITTKKEKSRKNATEQTFLTTVRCSPQE